MNFEEDNVNSRNKGNSRNRLKNQISELEINPIREYTPRFCQDDKFKNDQTRVS